MSDVAAGLIRNHQGKKMKYLTQAYKAWDYILAFFSYKQRLSRILNVDICQINKFYEEIKRSGFIEHLAEKSRVYRWPVDLSPLAFFRGPMLYVLCRLIRPETVVETGVGRGFSAAFILYALKKNDKGRLYSIDLPNQPGQELEAGEDTGWLVPEELRGRWNLIIGPSQDKLPQLLTELKKIDVFFHDSAHSYENMMFEFQLARQRLKDNLFLVTDDITENQAFDEFCRQHKYDSITLFKTGIAKKYNRCREKDR